jgi:hypothetical protein
MANRRSTKTLCTCPHCRAPVRTDRLTRHIARVHPRLNVRGIAIVQHRRSSRPEAQKPKRPADKPRNPFGNVVALRKTVLSRQRSGFVGALRYRRGRQHAAAISVIVDQCLSSGRRTGTRAAVSLQSAFRTGGVRPGEFDTLCNSFWPSNLSAGDRVFTILRAIGYEGNIDDLWVSVYGMRKPSVMRPSKKIPAKLGRRDSRRHGRAGSVFLTNTGQSRKPGSHRENRGHN